jgi:putative redox protein
MALHRPSLDPSIISRPPNVVRLDWAGDRKFDARRADGEPTIRIDGDSEGGQPSPVDALLASFGACVSVDVVDILRKQRTPPDEYSVEVVGTRVDTIPRRLSHVLLRVRARGAGIEPAQLGRAVELAVTRYCSVRDSLDPQIPVEWEVEVG